MRNGPEINNVLHLATRDRLFGFADQ